jgi:prepilin-type N-terminal cleavage/methylation domain-containing protein
MSAEGLNDRRDGFAPGERGFSLLELVVVMAIVSVLLGLLSLNLHKLGRPADDAASELSGYFKRARALALNSTRAYTLKPSGMNAVVATYGSSCSSTTQTPDAALTIELPERSMFTSTAWSVCFGTRGISDSSEDIEIKDDDGAKTVQVSLGGGTRIL